MISDTGTTNGTEYGSPMYKTGDGFFFESYPQAEAHAIINDHGTTGSTGVEPVSAEEFREFWY